MLGLVASDKQSLITEKIGERHCFVCCAMSPLTDYWYRHTIHSQQSLTFTLIVTHCLSVQVQKTHAAIVAIVDTKKQWKNHPTHGWKL